MGVWDAFTGKKTQPASPSPSSDTILQDPAGTVTFDAPTTDDVSAFLNQPGAYDPAALHPLAGLNQDTLDYLTLDDSVLSDLPGGRSVLPSRGWSDDLCYGTGVTYLTALSIGGAWGLAEGLNRLPSTAPPKLRLNSALNAVTRRGPFLGNSAGVVAMMYNGINSTIGYYRGKHDAFNSVAAGGISGMIFKATRGVRPMMISGGIVASVAGSWAVSGFVFMFRRHNRTMANSFAAHPKNALRGVASSAMGYSCRLLYYVVLQAWRWRAVECTKYDTHLQCMMIDRDQAM